MTITKTLTITITNTINEEKKIMHYKLCIMRLVEPMVRPTYRKGGNYELY